MLALLLEEEEGRRLICSLCCVTELLQAIKLELSKLSTTFSNNVLDSTKAFSLLVSQHNALCTFSYSSYQKGSTPHFHMVSPHRAFPRASRELFTNLSHRHYTICDLYRWRRRRRWTACPPCSSRPTPPPPPRRDTRVSPHASCHLCLIPMPSENSPMPRYSMLRIHHASPFESQQHLIEELILLMLVGQERPVRRARGSSPWTCPPTCPPCSSSRSVPIMHIAQYFL